VKKWKVTVQHENELRDYYVDAVAVCNGHHWDCIWPIEEDIPGIKTFTGEQYHSGNYRTPEPFMNKRVIVAGLGL